MGARNLILTSIDLSFLASVLSQASLMLRRPGIIISLARLGGDDGQPETQPDSSSASVLPVDFHVLQLAR